MCVISSNIVIADYAISLAAFKEGSRAEKMFQIKRRLKKHDGSFNWFLTRASPIFGVDGSLQYWCGSCTDIDYTEKMQHELKLLPDILSMPLWKASIAGEILFMNPKFQSFTGLLPTEKANAFSASLVHPEDYVLSKSAFEKAVKTKSSFEIERRLKGADGRYTWVLTRGSTVLDLDDNVIAVYGSCTDINAAKEAQEELQALPESLSSVCVYKISSRGDVVYANTTFKTYIGAKEGETFNVFSDRVVHKEDIKNSLTVFMKANKDKAEFQTGGRLKKFDGTYQKFGMFHARLLISVVTKGVPVISIDGALTHWYGTCTPVPTD